MILLGCYQNCKPGIKRDRIYWQCDWTMSCTQGRANSVFEPNRYNYFENIRILIAITLCQIKMSKNPNLIRKMEKVSNILTNNRTLIRQCQLTVSAYSDWQVHICHWTLIFFTLQSIRVNKASKNGLIDLILLVSLLYKCHSYIPESPFYCLRSYIVSLSLNFPMEQEQLIPHIISLHKCVGTLRMNKIQ